MTPFKQLYCHNPEGVGEETIGDCFRTAIGVLLDLPPAEIPHFAAMQGPCYFNMPREWLRENHNVDLGVTITPDNVDNWGGEAYLIASVPSLNCEGLRHVVVCDIEGTVVCDPSTLLTYEIGSSILGIADQYYLFTEFYDWPDTLEADD